MMQLEWSKTGQGAKIKLGDIVRLLHPFRPDFISRRYAFAIVAGVIADGAKTSNYHHSQPESGSSEIVVHLYEPESSTVYTDQFGIKALFSFNCDEVELIQLNYK